jgi:hypothetical protein
VSATTEVRTTCRGCGEPIEQPPSGRRRQWCSENCRRRHVYSGTCVDCGAQTSRGRGSSPNERCRPCGAKKNGADAKVWTREAIVAAIREWVVEFGEPPATYDWNPYGARHTMHDEARARRFEDAAGRWPSVTAAFDRFGSWQAAIAAAGYEPRPAHGGGGNVARRRSQRNPSKRGSSGHAERESAERSPDPRRHP